MDLVTSAVPSLPTSKGKVAGIVGGSKSVKPPPPQVRFKWLIGLKLGQKIFSQNGRTFCSPPDLCIYGADQ